MIQCTLADAGRYATLSPRLKTLFDFLKTHDLRQMPLGRIEVDGDAVFINNVECDLISHEEQKLEVHRRYIDVHIPLDRSEIIGWSPLSALGESEKPFDETADFALYPQLASASSPFPKMPTHPSSASERCARLSVKCLYKTAWNSSWFQSSRCWPVWP